MLFSNSQINLREVFHSFVLADFGFEVKTFILNTVLFYMQHRAELLFCDRRQGFSLDHSVDSSGMALSLSSHTSGMSSLALDTVSPVFQLPVTVLQTISKLSGLN